MGLERKIQLGAYALFIFALFLVPEFSDEFWLNRASKYLVYGMLGVSIALIWGYAGVLSLGHGLFFGMGAYTIAMSLKLASPTSLAQGSDRPIPDFMLWNAEPDAPVELCCITPGSYLWLPFESVSFGMVMGVLLPSVVAGILGTIVFKKRISGVFISIITLALVLLVRLLVIDLQPLTNGFNGLTDLAFLTIAGFEFDPYSRSTYYLCAASLALVLIGARLLADTRASLILQAIRDDDQRARHLGFNVPMYQTFFFVVSAAIAGYAGMLFVIASEFASPTFMDLSFSVAMVVWAAVGGRSSLLGACIGAIMINWIEAEVSEVDALVEAWKAIIGLIFVLVVVFLPRGLGGVAHDLAARIGRRARRKAKADAGAGDGAEAKRHA